jgi:hypothetical protein
VTLFETIGPRGLAERGPGAAHPVLHVLADVGERRDDALIDVECADPLAISALALHGAASSRVLVANHAPTPRAVRLEGLPSQGVTVRILDETAVELAMDDPVGFRALVDVAHDTSTGELALELGPYAVARIEA